MEACMLHTGYHKVPSRKMIWELMGDCRNDFIADSIRRDVLEAVMTNIHFRDNAYGDNDQFYKVHPIFENLNKSAQWLLPLSSSLYSVDETMVPYYGRHSCKQFIRGKPVRFGYKVTIIY